MMQFPIPLHQERQLDLFVPEPEEAVQVLEVETERDPSASEPSFILLIRFLLNLAALLFSDFQDLCRDVYEIYQAEAEEFEPIQHDLTGDTCVSKSMSRSASFILSSDGLVEPDHLSEAPIQVACEINNNQKAELPWFKFMPSCAESYLWTKYYAFYDLLIVYHEIQAKFSVILNEACLDATHDFLQSLVFGYTVIFEPKIQLNIRFHNIFHSCLEELCGALVYMLMALGDTETSPLHEEWHELEEIVHGQEPPLPVNLHSKFLMESPMMYANGFNTLCSHNYPL